MFDANEKRTIFFSSMTHFYTHFYMLTFTATNFVMASQLGISLTAIGDMGFIHNFLFGIGSLAGGFLINRLGAKRSILFSISGGSLFTLATALAPNPALITLSLGALGLSGSIYHAASLTMVANTIRSRGRGLAWHGIGGTLGSALAPMIAGFITQNIGWRWAYGLNVIPGVLMFAYGASSHIEEKAVDGDSLQRNIKKNSEIKKIAHPLLLLCLVYGLQICFGLFINGTTVFLPTYASKSINIPALGLQGIALGGFYTTIGLLAGLGGQVLGGEASERYKLFRLQFFVVLFTIPAIFMIGLTKDFMLILAIVLFSFFGFGWQLIGNGLVAYYTPARWRGYAYSISFALSFGVGALASSIAGRIADSYGLDKIFIVMGCIGLTAFLFSIPLWFLNKRAEKRD